MNNETSFRFLVWDETEEVVSLSGSDENEDMVSDSNHLFFSAILLHRLRNKVINMV